MTKLRLDRDSKSSGSKFYFIFFHLSTTLPRTALGVFNYCYYLSLTHYAHELLKAQLAQQPRCKKYILAKNI